MRQILRYTERKQRVRFGPEVEAYGLRLCFCDMSSKNFMKDNCGRIVAFNFGLSCFMPPSFFPFAQYVGTDFTRRVARRVKNPESTQLSAILGAFYATVPYGTDKIGEHVSLLSFLFLAVPLQGD